MKKNAGDTFTASDIPSFTVRSGYKIAGWYYDSNYTKRAVAGDTVDKDTTVYAKWISYDAVNAGVGATFRGHDYVPEIDWYTRRQRKITK